MEKALSAYEMLARNIKLSEISDYGRPYGTELRNIDPETYEVENLDQKVLDDLNIMFQQKLVFASSSVYPNNIDISEALHFLKDYQLLEIMSVTGIAIEKYLENENKKQLVKQVKSQVSRNQIVSKTKIALRIIGVAVGGVISLAAFLLLLGLVLIGSMELARQFIALF